MKYRTGSGCAKKSGKPGSMPSRSLSVNIGVWRTKGSGKNNRANENHSSTRGTGGKECEGRIMMGSNLCSKWVAMGPQIQSVLRIVAAIMFMLAGSVKLFAFPAGVPPNGGTVPLLSEAGFAGVLEVFGGALLLIGLYTRPVAFLLSGEMAVAYFQFHFPQNVWPVLSGGVPAVLYCFVWLYYSAAGGGPWSLDAMRKKSDDRTIDSHTGVH
jgi:putative oxidoreductase